MSKIKTAILAILGGIDVTFYIFTPIIIASLWVNIAGLQFSSYLLFGIGLISTFFRAIKIGFMK